MDSVTLDALLGVARDLLQTSSDQIIAQLSVSAAAFQMKAQAETEALQSEIAALRTQLNATHSTIGTDSSGGTGDMPQLRAVANNPVKGPPQMTVTEPTGNANVMTVYDQPEDNFTTAAYSEAFGEGVDLPEDELRDDRQDSGRNFGKDNSEKKKKPPVKRQSITNREGPAAEERKAKKAVFADASQMKEQIRMAVLKKEYNVMDFYKTEGWAQKVARSTPFDLVTLAVIAFNALWIMIDTDYNDADTLLDAHPVFQIAEHFFCAYFTAEWTIRFLSFEKKRNGFKDAWFCFDTALVTMMVLETWVGTIVLYFLFGGAGGSAGVDTSVLKMVRLVRLTRMARMARLLRALPELLILIKGIVVASRSVFFTLALLILITYVFGIVFVQLVSKDSLVDEVYFGTVPRSMLSLLLDGVLPDQAQIVRDTGDENFGFGVLVIIYILLASLTVMNMLIGVLCEVVSVVSAVEKEQLTVQYVKSQLKTMFEDIDDNGSASVSKEEFEALLVRPAAAQIIQEIGVDVIGLVDFADYIFKDDSVELNFADFMDLILQLRGTNTATVKDMVDLRRVMVGEVGNLMNVTKTQAEQFELALDNVTKLVQKQNGKQIGDSTPVTMMKYPYAQQVVTNVGSGPMFASQDNGLDNTWSRGVQNQAGLRQRPAASGPGSQASPSPMPRRPETANVPRGPPSQALPNRLYDYNVVDITADEIQPFWQEV